MFYSEIGGVLKYLLTLGLLWRATEYSKLNLHSFKSECFFSMKKMAVSTLIEEIV